MIKKIKLFLQKLLRDIHIKIFKKDIPSKISLCFHDLEDKDIQDIKTVVNYFKYLNFKFCTISYLNENISSSEKLIALTFDDGFSSWLKILQYFNDEDINATFFLNTIFFEKNNNLDRYYKNINSNKNTALIEPEQINQLIENGHEIGAHSHSHIALSRLNKLEFRNEISTNLTFLKNYFDIDIISFALPFGMRRHVKKYQIETLKNKFNSISFLEPGMLYSQEKGLIHRYPWLSSESFLFNLNNICSDTSWFNTITKRSGLG